MKTNIWVYKFVNGPGWCWVVQRKCWIVTAPYWLRKYKREDKVSSYKISKEKPSAYSR